MRPSAQARRALRRHCVSVEAVRVRRRAFAAHDAPRPKRRTPSAKRRQAGCRRSSGPAAGGARPQPAFRRWCGRLGVRNAARRLPSWKAAANQPRSGKSRRPVRAPHRRRHARRSDPQRRSANAAAEGISRAQRVGATARAGHPACARSGRAADQRQRDRSGQRQRGCRPAGPLARLVTSISLASRGSACTMAPSSFGVK